MTYTNNQKLQHGLVSSCTTTANADLQRERFNSAKLFNFDRITYFLDGGVERTKKRRQLELIVLNDPIFSNDRNNFLHRTDRHVRSQAKFVRLIEICRKIGIGCEDGNDGHITLSDDWQILFRAIADDPITASLHWVMFVPNIISLCDEEQKSRWLPLCRDWRMIGCYAQTELGHGSNVRALETTATFLHEKDGGMEGGSFVINSSTLTSMKFWPGTLGRTANHAMVIARLIDANGTDHGVHNFLVQLRSFDNHMPLPGISLGDIGPKIGYNNIDNGFVKFDNVMIPRRNMAMRFVTVDENGIYSKRTGSSNDVTAKVAYITMTQVRAGIIRESGKSLAIACTIAIRYSVVRRQGFKEESQEKDRSTGNDEIQVLDYVQQQHRLLSYLASSYCFYFAGQKVLYQLKDLEEKLLNANSMKSTKITNVNVSDMHATTSALKSFTTRYAADFIEDCRKSCGGHGFLLSCGIPELYVTFLNYPTVEGDNFMLPQQVIKVLLKVVNAVKTNNVKLLQQYESCNSRYLIPCLQQQQRRSCIAKNEESIMNLNIILDAFKHRATRLLLEVANQMKPGDSEKWNNAQVLMTRVSNAHSLVIILDMFITTINTEVDGKQTTAMQQNEVQILKDLAILFGLYWIEKEIGDFLEDAYMTNRQAQWVRSGVLSMLSKIRPYAIGLVDAWDFSDFTLKSSLGRYDGNVYDAIMDETSGKKNQLNQIEPGPGYKEHLKRLIVDGVGKFVKNSDGITPTVSRL